MASLGKSFNPTEHDTEQRGEYENIPDGDYKLEVSDADVKISGDGSQRKVGLKVTYDVLEPEDYKGRKVFDYFNLEHPSAEAQRIGQSQFASLCRAMSISDPVDDTDQIKFIAFSAKVGLGKPSKEKDANGNPAYPARNEIKRFYFPDEGDVPAPKANPRPAAANDNRPAGDARSTSNGGSAATKQHPWSKK